MKTIIQAAGKTDIGLVRKNNEDSVGFDVGLGMFVVYDGMGGQAAGQKASTIDINTVIGYFEQLKAKNSAHVISPRIPEVSEGANHLANAIHVANQSIRELPNVTRNGPGWAPPLLQCSAATRHFSIAHVGDSRIYLVRGQTIHLLTSDHSLVMEQVRRGLITMDEAEHSKMQNVIVRALGSEESVEPDLQDHEFMVGDVLLLCSDGLSRYAKEADMYEAIRAAASLDTACDELIALAKAEQSDDNITCLLVQATKQSWYSA